MEVESCVVRDVGDCEGTISNTLRQKRQPKHKRQQQQRRSALAPNDDDDDGILGIGGRVGLGGITSGGAKRERVRRQCISNRESRSSFKPNADVTTTNMTSVNDNGMTTTDNDDSTTSHAHAPAMALALAATKKRDLQDVQSRKEAADDPSTIGRPGAGPDTPPAGRRASTAGSAPEIMVIPSVSVWAEPESTSVNASPGGSTRAANHSAADLVDPSIHTTQGTGAQGKTPGRPHTLSSERGSPPPYHV